MGQSKICGTDEALNLLVDYGKKIYGDKKIEEIEKLENPFDKAKKLWCLLNPASGTPDITKQQDLDSVIEKLRDKLSDNAARIYMEKLINHEILLKLEQNEKEYMKQLKLQIINKHTDSESPATLRKYAQIEKKKTVSLSRQVRDMLCPHDAAEIIGQGEAMDSLISKIASPYPQHILIYGPPGVGKTSAARIALKEAKEKEYSPFSQDAPFIEVNGATIRWDPRESINPLLGSVHDPIHQGARRDLAETGIPEPKPGLVTEAHGGILFIDEIGELDLALQNKLLKVLEDKKVYFESSYYDENSSQIPKYIKTLFESGAPADFILVGATTRRPEEINPALRSRCSEVYFNSLSPKDIQAILSMWSKKLEMDITEEAKDLISKFVYDGRKAVNILLDCYSKCLYENHKEKACIDYEKAHEALGLTVESIRVKANAKYETGKVYGAGVNGFMGSIIEFEAVSFQRQDDNGNIRFNETAGSMIRDSLFNALTVLKKSYEMKTDKFDIHVNCIGGGKVDGPSAGAAITSLLYSSIGDKSLRTDTCITGEISINGDIKSVGGVREKVIAAIREGFAHMIIPKDNIKDALGLEGINIIPVEHIHEIIEFLSVDLMNS